MLLSRRRNDLWCRLVGCLSRHEWAARLLLLLIRLGWALLRLLGRWGLLLLGCRTWLVALRSRLALSAVKSFIAIVATRILSRLNPLILRAIIGLALGLILARVALRSLGAFALFVARLLLIGLRLA